MSYQGEAGKRWTRNLLNWMPPSGPAPNEKFFGLRKTPPASCIGDWSECRTTSWDFANCAGATTASSTGFTARRNSKLIRIYRVQHRSEVYREYRDL